MERLTVYLIILLLVPGIAHAKGYEAKKTVGGYALEIKIDKNPLTVGDNHIEIEIKDAAGNYVTDAKVLVNYYMPPMPRMVPMNFRTDARLKGEKYKAVLNLIMTGPWYIVIIFNRGEKTYTAKVNVDAQ